MPDIGVFDPGIPMDFHAYYEVYLGGYWHTYDARYNAPRIGRIKIAHGLDAVDGAFSTIYGSSSSASSSPPGWPRRSMQRQKDWMRW